MPRRSERLPSDRTPIVERLRPRTKPDEAAPCVEKLSLETQPSNSKELSSEKMEKMEGKMDMKEVLKHLEMLQERTEANMATAIVQAVEKSKHEINENIGLLTTSVLNIRSDLTNFEEKYNTRFETIESKIAETGKKSDLALSEVKRLEQIVREGKKSSNDKMRYIEDDATALKKKMDKELIGVRSELGRSLREHKAALEKQSQELLQWKEQLEQSVDDIKLRLCGNTNQLRQYATLVDSIDNKIRANNIVIEGYPEKADNDGNPLEDSINDISLMIQEVITDFKSTAIKTLARLGVPKNKGNKKPRPLLVCLTDQSTRERILRKAKNIKEKSGNKYLRLNRDQSENAKRKHSLVKSCYKLMLKNGFPCTIRGSIITYNKVQYNYDSLNSLPEGCTPHYARSTETSDNAGFCYSSEYVYCSNFFPCKVKYKGELYSSAEHAFQTYKVKIAGYDELAAEMMSMTDPYKIKGLGDGVKVKKDWSGNEDSILDEIIEVKFDQNPGLKTQLLRDGYATYHEMTTNRKWGTGQRVPQDGTLPSRESLTGSNKGGLAITRLKNQYCRTLGLQMPVVPVVVDESECQTEVQESYTSPENESTSSADDDDSYAEAKSDINTTS